MQLARLLKTLEGKRVSGVDCYCCGGHQAVLRQRWCKDELELFCDRCETWAGRCITTADVEKWMQQGAARPSLERELHLIQGARAMAG